MENLSSTLSKEESARDTGQSQYANYVVMEDIPIVLHKEDFALDTGQMLKEVAIEDVPF